MRVCALVPVKPLLQVKTRLSACLEPQARASLMADSLQRLAYVLRDAAVADQIAVISRDPDVLAWAQQSGLVALREHGNDLNAALRQGRRRLRAAEALLVLAADLLAVQPNDLRTMVQLARECASRCVVLAPDRRGSGTNALLLKPPSVIDFAFGEDSARRHAAQAMAKRVPVHWYHSETIGLDIDWPEDLYFYAAQW
ncbi:MAG: 2-phospho-L-lactate guanylyltransferase [Thermoflexales bacterium]